MDNFRIKAYSKAELAMLYFPTDSNTHISVNRLMSWINRNTTLLAALYTSGYRKSSKFFTPRQVRLIVDYLGEP